MNTISTTERKIQNIISAANTVFEHLGAYTAPNKLTMSIAEYAEQLRYDRPRRTEYKRAFLAEFAERGMRARGDYEFEYRDDYDTLRHEHADFYFENEQIFVDLLFSGRLSELDEAELAQKTRRTTQKGALLIDFGGVKVRTVYFVNKTFY